MTRYTTNFAAAFAAVLIMGMSFSAVTTVPVQPAYAAVVTGPTLA